jgi:hypothetical protein
MAVFDSSGTRLGVTGDTSADWEANTGLRTHAITGGPLALSAGWVYIAILANGTAPSLRQWFPDSGSGLLNMGLAAAASRSASYGVASDYAAGMPAGPLTLSANSADSNNHFVAIS